MSRPQLKNLCRSPGLKLGHFVVEFATPGIGHILAGADCDYVLFDMEHSGFGFETVKSTIRYFEAAGLPMIVRVPSKAYDHLARAADMGADAIMIPMVDSGDEARQLVEHAMYTPAGHRGVALGIAHDRYRSGPVMEKLASQNEKRCLFAQIETKGGVDDADAIAATQGIDCLWVGHFDLSSSLGIPGQFDHPDFLAAVKRVGAACARHGKAFGRLVPDVETGIACVGQGFDFLCYSGDAWLLQAALRDGLAQIRATENRKAGGEKTRET